MTKKHIQYIHEDEYVAEVDVELTNDEEGWGPYLTLKDARKLDEVRLALRRKDMKTATKYARVFSLTPVVIS